MRYVISISVWIVLSTPLASCGKAGVAIQVNGIDVNENERQEATNEIGARLRFEHDCDGPYEYVLIKREYRYPSEVGVVACRRKWIFTRTTDGITTGPWRGRQTAFSFIPTDDEQTVDGEMAPEAGDAASATDRSDPYKKEGHATGDTSGDDPGDDTEAGNESDGNTADNDAAADSGTEDTASADVP